MKMPMVNCRHQIKQLAVYEQYTATTKGYGNVPANVSFLLHISQRLLAFPDAAGRPEGVTISETERTRETDCTLNTEVADA